MTRAAGAAARGLHARGLVPAALSRLIRGPAAVLAAEGTYTYRDGHGHVVEADLGDYMERIGFFGADDSRLLRRIGAWVRPGDWVIDAGANVGLVSSMMAAAVGRQGCVWAIEPLPRNVERLRALKQRNHLSQLEVLPFALSAEATTARLRLPVTAGSSGWGSLVDAPWPSDEHVDVPTRRLDDLVAASAPDRRLRLVKVDVEGAEPELLAGARVTLATRRPLVLCEFNDVLLRAAGSSSQDLLAQFADSGYFPQPPFARPAGSLEGRVVDMLLAPSGWVPTGGSPGDEPC